MDTETRATDPTSEPVPVGPSAGRDAGLPVGRKPRRDDVFEVTVERLDADGCARGQWGPYGVRLRHGVPGQRLWAQVNRRRRERIEARVLDVLDPGPHAVRPRCRHFGTCGGCAFQDVAYSTQLTELGRIVREIVEPLGPPHIEPVIGAEDPWAYRNKMELTFSNRRWRMADEPADLAADFALGLHRPGRARKVVDLTRCEIQFEEANAIMASARRLARDALLAPWDPVAHQGLLRHLVLRKGIHTGEIMVNLVTSEDAPEKIEPYAAALLRAHPEVTTLVQNVTTRLAVVAAGEHERILYGPGVIRERLHGVLFTISASSFFQTNTRQAERLLSVVEAQAGLTGREVVYDLYCGVGTIALSLARRARSLWGFEIVEEAVRDARRNAVNNDVSTCRFEAGDLAETLSHERLTALGAPAPDVCIVDPPRAGMHKRVVRSLRALAPARLVYVSCNVASAARDLVPFVEDGYRVTRVQPIDLFPHTPHLECVLTLER